MKPINLTPSGAGASVPSSTGPSSSTIGIGIGAAVLVVCVGGYFGFARVSTVKEETARLTQQKTEADTKNAGIVTQLNEIGAKPATESWSSVAVSYTKDVIDTASARADYPRFLADLSKVRVKGAWFVSVSAGANGDDAAASTPDSATASLIDVKYDGYARSLRDVNAIVSNINALDGISDAEVDSIEVARATNGTVYRHFTIVAKMEPGTVATTGSDGELVANGSTGVNELALDPKPEVAIVKTKKVVVVPKPADPLAGLVRDTKAAGGTN